MQFAAPRFAPLAACAMLLLIGTACASDVVEPAVDELCREPSAGPLDVSVLELGHPTMDAFVAMETSDAIERLPGHQGEEMLVVRLRAEGDVPTCVMTDFEATNQFGKVVIEDTFMTRFVPQEDGSHVTEPTWLRIGFPYLYTGDQVTVRAWLGGKSASCELEVVDPNIEAKL